MARPPAQIYQIKVTLNDTRPPIWRRVRAPGSATLRQLHELLQSVMGWHDSHLHEFTLDGQHYGDPQSDEGGEMGIRAEARYKLSQVAPAAGARFSYAYDFGDGWEHTLLVEKIEPSQPGAPEVLPRCLAGKRACPPEDVGGVWGYALFLEAIGDPEHAEHDRYLEWVGGEFDPDAFDLDQVNAGLRQLGRGRGAEAGDWAVDERGQGGAPRLDTPWARTLAADERATAESLPLRRDLLTLLTYLRDNRVTGTQGKGNLPLKAVHALCAQFVHPPQLEDVVGDKVYRVRSESEIWPLYFVHLLASVAGLVAGGPARRWRTTPLGERFMDAEAPLQVWLLSATWWTQVNWAVASPWSYGQGEMPPAFTGATLKRLLALPVGESVPVGPFAAGLIADARLIWPIQDQSGAHTILHWIIKRVVIGPLHDFGILATESEPDPLLGQRFHELVAFRVTPFGRGLLEAIRQASQ